MKKSYLLYLGILSLSLGNQNAFSMDLSKKLTELVETKNLSEITSFKKDFIDQIGKSENLVNVQEEIDKVFVEPISSAIEKNEYDLAYFLIKESQFNSKDNKNQEEVLIIDLLAKNQAGNSLLRLILNSNNPLLLVSAHSWIAKKLIMLYEKTEEKEPDAYEKFMGITHDSLKEFIDDVQASGLTLATLKDIIIQTLVITNNTKNEPLMDKLEKQNLDIKNPLLRNLKIKAVANNLLTRAILSPTSNYEQHATSALSQGADINARNIVYEDTVLILAIKDTPAHAQFLIDKQVDVNLWGSWKQTPLMAAVLKKNLDIIKKLIEKGANVNAQDVNGQTALSLIAQDIEQLILNTAAKSITKSTETAENIINALLEKGAKVDIKDNFGFSPIDYAQSSHNDTIVALMRKNTKPTNHVEQLTTLEALTSDLITLSNTKGKS